MELNKNELIVLKALGLSEIPKSESDRDDLFEKLENILLNKGITNDKINNIGLACESLLDKLEN